MAGDLGDYGSPVQAWTYRYSVYLMACTCVHMALCPLNLTPETPNQWGRGTAPSCPEPLSLCRTLQQDSGGLAHVLSLKACPRRWDLCPGDTYLTGQGRPLSNISSLAVKGAMAGLLAMVEAGHSPGDSPPRRIAGLGICPSWEDRH
jgi:hypothetical protein